METKKNNSLWGNFFKSIDPWAKRVSSLWAETPLFNHIPKRKITLLVKNMHLRRYQVGEYIFHSGDQGAGAALVLSGKIEIRAGDVVLATLSEGDFLVKFHLYSMRDERLMLWPLRILN